MRITFAALALAAGSLALPVQAQSTMSLANFLETADRLERRGILALFSSDFKKLEREIESASAHYRERLEADKEAGRAPDACPAGPVAISSDEILEHFRSYPQAQRSSVTVQRGFEDMIRQTYPCS